MFRGSIKDLPQTARTFTLGIIGWPRTSVTN